MYEVLGDTNIQTKAESDKGLPGLKSRCLQGAFLSGGSRESVS